MRWFGEPWKGDVCNVLLRIQNPGGHCCFCGRKLGKNARGFAFEGGAVCHKKCLSRSITGKTWVDHIWTTKMHSLWDRGWTCSRCGVVVFGDPKTKKGREKNAYDRKVTKNCLNHLVDAVSKL